jgi:hypothetical protein
MGWAIGAVGGLTVASGVVVALVMGETLPPRHLAVVWRGKEVAM